MKTYRLALIVGAAAAAGYLYACTVPQPLPECNAATGAFFAKYKLKSGTGPCSELKGDEIGFQRYRVPGKNEASLAIRAATMGSAASGDLFVVEENPVPRVDPTDKDGKKLNALGKFTVYPDKDGICQCTEISPATQSFQEESLDLSDGGTEVLPALKLSYEWSNLKMTNTANVPGTVFTAELKYTEDSCTATYEVLGFWPPVHCKADDDCNPEADLDAGRITGSGINPDFQPKCNKETGYCEPSVAADTLR